MTISIRSARDVNNLINSGAAAGSNARMIVFLALGGIFLDAYDFTSLAYGMKDITAEFGLSPVWAGVVNASIMVGAVVGALFGGVLVDRIGRYRVFMADMLFFVVAALGCAFALNEYVLVFFRFLMGIGVGMDLPVAMAFLAEFSRLTGKGSKASRTAAWAPAWFTATSACYLIILGLYQVVPHADLWRYTVGFGAVPAIVILLVRKKYMNESPAWAAQQGDLERAASILRDSYGVDAVAVSSPPVAAPPRGSFRPLFSRTYRLRTTLALAVALAQTFAYNAVAYGLPVIIASFLAQGPLTTITASLVLNLGFAVTGGLLGIRWARSGAWRMTVLGFAVQLGSLVALALIGKPSSALALAALLSLGAFGVRAGLGAGGALHDVRVAELPDVAARRGGRVQPGRAAGGFDAVAVPVPDLGGVVGAAGVLGDRSGARARVAGAAADQVGARRLRRRRRGRPCGRRGHPCR